MDEFSERLRSATASHARRAADARAPRSLRGRVARARTVRIGSTAGVAALALAGIGVAGAGFTGLGEAPEPSPSPSVDLSIDGGSVAYATVPFPEEQEGLAGPSVLELCGEPAPTTDAADEDFTAMFETPASLELSNMGEMMADLAEPPIATLTYSGSEPVPLFADHPQAVFVRDGVVVGIAWPNGEVSVTTLEQGGSISRAWQWTGVAQSCDPDAEFAALEAGDYEMMLVMRAHNDEQSAAVHGLRMQYFTLPARSEVAALSEGAYECGDDYMWGGAAPITCNPNALPGVEIDEEAGTVTIPYDSSYYSKDVDLTWVSAPMSVTLEGDTRNYPAELDELPAYERGTVPACGDIYASINSGNLSGTWTEQSAELRDAAPGDRLEATFWFYGGMWSSATMDIPTDPRLWVMREEDVEIETGDDNAYWYVMQEVVGWVDTESASGGSTFEISRYDGPEPWELTVTDVQWCDGVDPQADLDSPRFEMLPGMIAEPVTVTVDDHDAMDLDAIVIQR